MTPNPLLFVERLAGPDLEMLAALEGAPSRPERLRSLLDESPGRIEDLLADPELYELIYESSETGVIAGLTPLFAFAVLVHRTMRDLTDASYVPEWVGAGERLPVFDAPSLREFIDDITRRYLMAEFLGSFTRVASGAMWVRTERGYKRRRYSELDPLGLAEMVESLPTAQRTGGYKRLGDVALFLTGVFPDHTARHPMSEMSQARLARIAGVEVEDAGELEYMRFLEKLGRTWYERAASQPMVPSGLHETLEDLASNFTLARRFLNYLADRYLNRLDAGLMNPVG